MFDPMLLLIALAFLLAGFIKGVIGLGLPTVSMGLLAVTMPPAQAIAIVIVPAIVTNIWQTFVGSYLRDIIRLDDWAGFISAGDDASIALPDVPAPAGPADKAAASRGRFLGGVNMIESSRPLGVMSGSQR